MQHEHTAQCLVSDIVGGLVGGLVGDLMGVRVGVVVGCVAGDVVWRTLCWKNSLQRLQDLLHRPVGRLVVGRGQVERRHVLEERVLPLAR